MISPKGKENGIGNKIINAPIACNGKASNINEYLNRNVPHLFLFTGNKSTIESAYSTYDLFDYVVNNYLDKINPIIVTKLVPMGLSDREIILDLDGELYEAFNIGNQPKMAVIDDNNMILGISETVTKSGLKVLINNILKNKSNNQKH